MSTTELAPAFFLALIVILVVCRLVGRLLRAAGQPPVVGEMVAGVVLGPSVLGLLAPGASLQEVNSGAPRVVSVACMG